MRAFSATAAKRNFGLALAAAASEAVAIERHGKAVAVLLPPHRVPDQKQERLAARQRQTLVEAGRLIKHQGIAIQLLKARPAAARRKIAGAMRVVDRWQAQQLCSRHFIDRWRRLLALPVPALAEQMCGEADGWGPALRQNSPWPRE